MNASLSATRTNRVLTDAWDPTLQPMRWRDPSIGRFTTADNLEGDRANPISLNLYLYAGADPGDHGDPGGHDFIGTLFAVAGISTLAGIAGGIFGGIEHG